MSGFTQIRLYSNASNSTSVSWGVYDDTDELIGSVTATITPNVLYDYENCRVTVIGLLPGTQHRL